MIQYKRVISTLIYSYVLFSTTVSEAKVDNKALISKPSVGMATYYSDKFHGRPTASGEIYNKHQLTAVHPTLPFGSILKVTNLRNHLSVNVRVNDRGNFYKKRGNKHLLDLSKQAASKLQFVGKGWAKVEIKLLQRGQS